MRTAISLILGSGLLLTTASVASAVNCDQVRRYLSTGRSIEDVAETMIISVDEVKKCQQSGSDDKAAPKGQATPGQGKAGN